VITTAPVTDTPAEPTAACTIGLPDEPGCTSESASAPLPDTIPPDKATACAAVLAVASALTTKPPPELNGASRRARVDPSQLALATELPLANSPPPAKPAVSACNRP
jgi:hypothetical protein